MNRRNFLGQAARLSATTLREGMLGKYYPGLKIINGEPAAADVQDAFKAADFFLHGSGPSVVAANFIDAWGGVCRL